MIRVQRGNVFCRLRTRANVQILEKLTVIHRRLKVFDRPDAGVACRSITTSARPCAIDLSSTSRSNRSGVGYWEVKETTSFLYRVFEFSSPASAPSYSGIPYQKGIHHLCGVAFFNVRRRSGQLLRPEWSTVRSFGPLRSGSGGPIFGLLLKRISAGRPRPLPGAVKNPHTARFPQCERMAVSY